MKITSKRALPVVAATAGAALVISGPAGTAGAARSWYSPRPAYLSVPDRLYSVAAASPRDIWAAGLMPTTSLIMHWNGRKWTVAFTKPVGYFLGMTATSARNAWAVGGTNWFSPSQTLAEHWNGRTWTQVRTQSPGEGGYFQGVTATSARNAWAVGVIAPGGNGVTGPTVPLIERWNGRAWRQQKFALPGDGGELYAVAATSFRNAWAVGWAGSGPSARALIEHWNGSKWTRLNSHTPDGEGYLYDVTVISARDAWAVGHTESGGLLKPLILHWNGRRWRVRPSPNPTGDTALLGVTASSPRNAWAVGYTNPNSCTPQCSTAIFHWNGRAWAVVPSPNPPSIYLNCLFSVVDFATRNAWAVGTTDYAATLIVHWNGKTWH